MKKLIALAAVSLALGACDPYEDEPGGTPAILEAVVSGRLDGPWFDRTPDRTGVFTPDTTYDGNGDEVPGTPSESTVAPPTSTDGRIIVVKTNVLLDGSSIEATPQSCLPTGANPADPATTGWLNVTAAPALTGGRWYACYYPGTPTALEGASIVVYYSARPPGVQTIDSPLRAGVLLAGSYAMNGTITTKSGTPLTFSVSFTVE